MSYIARSRVAMPQGLLIGAGLLVTVLFVAACSRESEGPSYRVELSPVSDRDGDEVSDMVCSLQKLSGAEQGRVDIALLSSQTGGVIRALRQVTGAKFVTLAEVGDMDNDGCRDIAVGAPSSVLGKQGRLIVVSARTSATLLEWSPPSAGSGFGSIVVPLAPLETVPGPLVCVVEPLWGERLETHAYIVDLGGKSVRAERSLGALGSASAITVVGESDIDGDRVCDVVIGSAFYQDRGLLVALSGSSLEEIWRVENSQMRELGQTVLLCPDMNEDGVSDVLTFGRQASRVDGREMIGAYCGRSGVLLHNAVCEGFDYCMRACVEGGGIASGHHLAIHMLDISGRCGRLDIAADWSVSLSEMARIPEGAVATELVRANGAVVGYCSLSVGLAGGRSGTPEALLDLRCDLNSGRTVHRTFGPSECRAEK